MTASPKMDDDGLTLTKAQIEKWRSHWMIQFEIGPAWNELNKLCNLALSALESRSEVLEEVLALQPMTHDPYTHAWAQAIRALKSPRAEPGAPERTLEQDSEDAYHFAEPKPAGAQNNAAEQAGHDLATSPSQEGHDAGPASAAPDHQPYKWTGDETTQGRDMSFCHYCERKEGDICDVINCPHDPRRQPAPSQTGTPTPSECCAFVIKQLHAAGYHAYADRIEELIAELSQAKRDAAKVATALVQAGHDYMKASHTDTCKICAALAKREGEGS